MWIIENDKNNSERSRKDIAKLCLKIFGVVICVDTFFAFFLFLRSEFLSALWVLFLGPCIIFEGAFSCHNDSLFNVLSFFFPVFFLLAITGIIYRNLGLALSGTILFVLYWPFSLFICWGLGSM